MTSEKKFFAKLYPADGNMTRTWFIKFSVRDFDSGTLKPKKYKGHLNLIADKDERLREAKRLLRAIELDEELPNVKGARRLPPADAPKNFANTIQLAHKSLENIKYSIDAMTAKGYKSCVTVLHKWMQETGRNNLPVGKFTVQVAKEFLRWLKANNYSNQSHNCYRSSLGRIWKEMKTDGIVSVNPWKETMPLQRMSVPFRAWPLHVEKIIRDNMPVYDAQLWIASQFVYYEFVRIVELRRLKLWMINWSTQSITLPATVSRKGKKERSMVLSDELADQLIKSGYHLMNQEFYIFSENGSPGEKQLSYNNFSKRFSDFREKFGIPPVYKMYGGKHTGNAKLARMKVGARIQQLHNGHSSLEYTQRYVSSVNLDDTEFLKRDFPKIGDEIQAPTE